MTRPTDYGEWATDANFPAGSDDWSGQPNKVDPGAGAVATGFIPQNFLAVEEINYLLSIAGKWHEYLDKEASALDLFGDGSDGDVTVGPGTTTLTRDMFYNNLIIGTGRHIDVGGHRIFVKGKCTIQAGASIHANGAAGALHVGGTARVSRAIGGGSAGANGRENTAGDGADAAAVTKSLGGAGGAGGDGDTAAGHLGGAGGGVTAPDAVDGGTRGLPFMVTGRLLDGSKVEGGGGGGGGGLGDAVMTTPDGGGGGAGGGVVLICARELDSLGTISANGGAGNDGLGSGPEAGAGGGGGGGAVLLTYHILTNLGTVQALGGAGGQGNQGSAGLGLDGANGAAGTVRQWQV